MRTPLTLLLSLTSVSAALAQSSNADSTAAAATPSSEPAPAKGVLPLPDYSGDLRSREQLTGDWNGQRTKLAEKGLQFQFDWVQSVQTVTSGGRDTGTRYGGNFDYVAFVDLYRMGLLPGAMLKLRGESRYGESVNDKSGILLPVNTAAYFPLTDTLDQSIPFTLTDVALFQYLSDKFALFGGKLDTLDGDPNEFASGRGDTQFMNSNFVFNSVSALTVPYSTLGGGLLWSPTPRVSLTTSIFNTTDSSTTTGFDHVEDGWSWSAEADIQYRIADLPGGFNVGGIYAWANDFVHFGKLLFTPGEGLAVSRQSDTWAAYLSAWQYLYVEEKSDAPIRAGDGKPDRQGVGLFARFGFADRDTNPVEWTINGGVGGRGILPGRDNDQFGIGYYYTSLRSSRFLNAVGIDDYTQGFESYYNIALTPAALLTVDAQVVESPSKAADTAVVLGVRLHLKF